MAASALLTRDALRMASAKKLATLPSITEDTTEDEATDEGSDQETVCTSQGSDSEEGQGSARFAPPTATARCTAPSVSKAAATSPPAGTWFTSGALKAPPGMWFASEAQKASPAPIPAASSVPVPRCLLGAQLPSAAAEQAVPPHVKPAASPQSRLDPIQATWPAASRSRAAPLPSPHSPAAKLRFSSFDGLDDLCSGHDATTPLKKRVTPFFERDPQPIMMSIMSA